MQDKPHRTFKFGRRNGHWVINGEHIVDTCDMSARSCCQQKGCLCACKVKLPSTSAALPSHGWLLGAALRATFLLPCAPAEPMHLHTRCNFTATAELGHAAKYVRAHAHVSVTLAMC
jgi:hypothetical protein